MGSRTTCGRSSPSFPLDLSGVKVALDCANGATHRAAPAIFERLGAEVEAIAAEPDGRNINDGCGSTHLDHLAAHVVACEAAIGFAFDGDGDRVLAVDVRGRAHDGDELIALVARGMAARGELDGGVAVTVMSNYGFHRAMEEAGIEVAVTKVGDRYVLDELRRRGWALGGEQSGHIIDTGFVATGDGIAAALMTMRELDGRDLAAVEAMEKLPQTLVNVEVADREAIAGAATVWAGGRARERRARGPRPRPAPPLRHRAAGPGDGRGADRRGGGRGLRAPRRHRPARAGLSGRPLLLVASYVRNRRIRGGAPLSRPPGRRPREARIPRL